MLPNVEDDEGIGVRDSLQLSKLFILLSNESGASENSYLRSRRRFVGISEMLPTVGNDEGIAVYDSLRLSVVGLHSTIIYCLLSHLIDAHIEELIVSNTSLGLTIFTSPLLITRRRQWLQRSSSCRLLSLET
jgi:hypothetical protein